MTEPLSNLHSFERRYRCLARRLERVVASRVRAPRQVIEEACQDAWVQLLRADPPLADHVVLSWLATTATRSALGALRTHRPTPPLGPDPRSGECASVIELPALDPGPDRVAELHEQIATIHSLPVRQQRIVWLHGLGYGYAEIAQRTGDTRRTVERQLLRAKQALNARAA